MASSTVEEMWRDEPNLAYVKVVRMRLAIARPGPPWYTDVTDSLHLRHAQNILIVEDFP